MQIKMNEINQWLHALSKKSFIHNALSPAYGLKYADTIQLFQSKNGPNKNLRKKKHINISQHSPIQQETLQLLQFEWFEPIESLTSEVKSYG